MNIYRVTNEKGESFTANTDELMDKLYITRDSLYWHVKTQTQYCGYMIAKIGTDGKANKPKKELPQQTKINNGLNDDLAKARQLGLSYGMYKLTQIK